MSKSQNSNHTSEDNTHIHFRRCHVCGEMNESENKLVERCFHCKKSLAPFVFFDEKKALGIADVSPENPLKKASSYKITRLATQSIYPPIWGLTVYW
jgi:hypothetical protein